MKFYHSVNKYILERYPLLWNTHFVWMMLAGILMNVIFYVYGYKYLDFGSLQEGTYSRFFEKSQALLYFIIILIILSIYWALQFFRHGGLNSFYQVSKFYFIKLFAIIFTILAIFTIVPFSFNQGIKDKAHIHISDTEYEQANTLINHANVFLLRESDDYNIINRSYPSPFPLTELQNEHKNIEDAEDGVTHGIDKSKPYVHFSYNDYQFGRLKEVGDTCNRIQIVDTVIDVSKVYGIAAYSVYNYSKFQIGLYDEFGDKFSPTTDTLDLSKIHSWILKKDTAEITDLLADYDSMLNNYKIFHNIEPKEMSTEILSKGGILDPGYFPLVGEVSYDASQVLKSEYKYYVDFTNLEQLMGNREFIVKSGWTEVGKLWTIFFYMCLALAVTLIIVKHLDKVSVLIGVVIASLILAICGLLTSFHNSITDSFDDQWSLWMLLLMIVIAGYLFICTSKKASLKWVKWMYLSFVVALVFLPIFLNEVIGLFTKYDVDEICNNTITKYPYQFNMWVFIALYILLTLIAFKVLRFVKSRPE